MADINRTKKIADKIRQIVANRLDKGLRDTRLGFVTITDVKVTGDLQHASIFYTVYGSAKEIEESAQVLKSTTGLFRSEIGKHLKLRLTPTIEFILDSLPDDANSLISLLDEAKKRDEEIRSLASKSNYVAGDNPYMVNEKSETFEEDNDKV